MCRLPLEWNDDSAAASLALHSCPRLLPFKSASAVEGFREMPAAPRSIPPSSAPPPTSSWERSQSVCSLFTQTFLSNFPGVRAEASGKCRALWSAGSDQEMIRSPAQPESGVPPFTAATEGKSRPEWTEERFFLSFFPSVCWSSSQVSSLALSWMVTEVLFIL